MPKGVYSRQPRPKKQYDAALVERVRALYDAGRTQAEIGREVGVSQKVVFTLMAHHGIVARIAAKRDQRGDRNSSWKGDDATYAAFHYRLYAKFGKPTKCSTCGTDRTGHYDYANLTGHYQDIADYAPMCRSCHWKLDGKVTNITGRKEGCNA